MGGRDPESGRSATKKKKSDGINETKMLEL